MNIFRYGEEPNGFKGYKPEDVGSIGYEFYYFTKQVSMTAEVIDGIIYCYWPSSHEYRKADKIGLCFGQFDNITVRHSVNKKKHAELSV